MTSNITAPWIHEALDAVDRRLASAPTSLPEDVLAPCPGRAAAMAAASADLLAYAVTIMPPHHRSAWIRLARLAVRAHREANALGWIAAEERVRGLTKGAGVTSE
jgi:hypothetical protein